MADEDGGLIFRPVSEDELTYFELWVKPGVDPFNFFGFKTGRRLRQEFGDNGLITEQAGTLLLLRNEDVVGDVSWHAQPYGPPGAGHAFNIGIRLLPEHRGRGYGAAAQRQLADYLFATYPVNRVEASTDVDNHREQRALEKAGFLREGVFRGVQWRAGRWHDVAVYSRLRADP